MTRRDLILLLLLAGALACTAATAWWLWPQRVPQRVNAEVLVEGLSGDGR